METLGQTPSVIVVPSRNLGHAPHRVTLTLSRRAGIAGPSGTLYVSCNCAGGRNAFANANIGRNSACYAMKSIGAIYSAFIPGITPAPRPTHTFRLPRDGNAWGLCSVMGCGEPLRNAVHTFRP